MALPGTSNPDRPDVSRVPVPSAPTASADWPVQATDQIVKVVDTVRDKTTGPALDAARWATYGLVLVILAIPLLLLAWTGLVRGLEGILLAIGSATGYAPLHDPIGFVYLGLGVVLCLAGLITSRKGKPATATS